MPKIYKIDVETYIWKINGSKVVGHAFLSKNRRLCFDYKSVLWAFFNKYRKDREV